LGLAACTVLGWRAGRFGSAQYLWQSIADVVALSALIFLTGGAFNPVISLFLLPIVIAATAMKPFHIAGITILAAGSYTMLMFIDGPKTHAHEFSSQFDLHVWGMWYGFILSATCVALLVARISRRLRARDLEVAIAREELLKAERLLQLGTMAASAAHELGSPLSSMAILTDELALGTEGKNDTRLLNQMRDQIERCKAVLARMTQEAGAMPASEGEAVTVADYVGRVVEEWRHRHVGITIDYRGSGPSQSPRIVADRVITQAIVNVLDNAAEASVRAIEVRGIWDGEVLALDVVDDGSGIPEGLRGRLGHETVTTKTGGMGIGLLLSRSILERLGGSLEFMPAGAAGTHVRLSIPLRPLLAG
jgi:two-component system sensor histidine kinase RegB